MIKLDDGKFGVQVLHPDGRKETVIGFKNEPAAAAWAALQKFPRKSRSANNDAHQNELVRAGANSDSIRSG
jgi:hypothetical protein